MHMHPHRQSRFVPTLHTHTHTCAHTHTKGGTRSEWEIMHIHTTICHLSKLLHTHTKKKYMYYKGKTGTEKQNTHAYDCHISRINNVMGHMSCQQQQKCTNVIVSCSLPTANQTDLDRVDTVEASSLLSWQNSQNTPFITTHFWQINCRHRPGWVVLLLQLLVFPRKGNPRFPGMR